MAETTIEWTDFTFNPWIGCTKVSPGCDGCYAEKNTASRALGVKWGLGEARRITSEDTWNNPVKWNAQAAKEGRRYRVFCASLADVFDAEVADTHRIALFELIAETPNLDWQILTKRAAVMAKWAAAHGWPANAWAGVSVENQAMADLRIPELLKVPAPVRFLSCEPLLGPVDLRLWLPSAPAMERRKLAALRGDVATYDAMAPFLDGLIGWVIVGGESGPGARPMHPNWARSLRDQCQAADVPFLFKQWGEWASRSTAGDDPHPAGTTAMALPDGRMTDTNWNGGPGPHLIGAQPMVRVGKKAAGRRLDGREWNEFPEPRAAAKEPA